MHPRRDRIEDLKHEIELKDRILQRVSRGSNLQLIFPGFFHEQKNSLNTLSAMLSDLFFELGKFGESPHIKELISVIVKVVDDLQKQQRYVHDLVYGGVKRPSELISEIQAMSILFRAKLEKNNIELLVSVDDDLKGCTFPGGDILQILVNLVENSIDSLVATGSASKEISITGRLQGQEVTVTVGDTGLGIPGHIGDRIWIPGFTTRQNRIGMGLNIARMIAERLGGRLSKSSSDKGYTAFILTLPIGRN